MKKYRKTIYGIKIFSLIFLLTYSMATGDIRAFDKFKAPEVSGAYSALWMPLGPTDRGVIYSV
jgi:hypothetical protein